MPIKRYSLLLFFMLMAQGIYAQREYWGVTTKGGNGFVYDPNIGIINEGLGVIFKTDKTGHNQEVAFNFDSATGFDAQHSLTLASNGKLYGLTDQVGSSSDTILGVLFEYDIVAHHYSIKKYFSSSGGGLAQQEGCYYRQMINYMAYTRVT